MDEQAIYDMLVELQDCFRGPVIDNLDDAVARSKTVCSLPREHDDLFGGEGIVVHSGALLSPRAGHHAHKEALERLAGMIAAVRLRLDSTERSAQVQP